MTRPQQFILIGTIAAAFLLLFFRKGKTIVEGGALNVSGLGSVGSLKDEGIILEAPGFDWEGGDCSCEMVVFDIPDIELVPPYFGQAAAFVSPPPFVPSPALALNPLPPPVAIPATRMPPAPSLPPPPPAVTLTYRAATLHPGDSWITKKGPGKVPGGSSLGALAWRLSTGEVLAIGLSNRPFVQENVFSPNSPIMYNGRRYYRADPI